MRKSFPLVLPLVALFLVAGAKKEPATGVTVRFYSEGIAGDVNTDPDPIQLQDPDRKIYRAKVATISERDIAGIWPFRTPDDSIGCVFVLTDAGRVALDRLTVEKRGTSLTAEVGGRLIINLDIDRRIPDGVLVIPHGMTVQEGLALKRTFPVVKPPASVVNVNATPAP